jgi:hypothetical protein
MKTYVLTLAKRPYECIYTHKARRFPARRSTDLHYIREQLASCFFVLSGRTIPCLLHCEKPDQHAGGAEDHGRRREAGAGPEAAACRGPCGVGIGRLGCLEASEGGPNGGRRAALAQLQRWPCGVVGEAGRGEQGVGGAFWMHLQPEQQRKALPLI